MAASDLQLPAGFRFHPTDEELVVHYLCRKCTSQPISVPIIAEIDLYKHDPWHLPGLALYGEKEWYFFSHRERKYPNGSRPNRCAGSGYWKATGADKQIGHPMPVGIKKALVFYSGKAPRGQKTNWIMHEYRLANVDRSGHNNISSRKMDDWVLCRIYNKKGAIQGAMTSEEDEAVTSVPEASSKVHDDIMYLDASDSIPGSDSGEQLSSEMESSPKLSDYWENPDVNFSFPQYLDSAGDLIMPPEFAYDGENKLN